MPAPSTVKAMPKHPRWTGSDAVVSKEWSDPVTIDSKRAHFGPQILEMRGKHFYTLGNTAMTTACRAASGRGRDAHAIGVFLQQLCSEYQGHE